MTYEELKQLKTSRGGSLVGLRVVVTKTPRKKGYEMLKGCKGVIIRDGTIDYGIRIDNMYNRKSSLELFWIDALNFETLDKEKENINMNKLTGYVAVAVVELGRRDYHYAIYEDGIIYKQGDKVIVSGSNTIKTVKEVITPEEAKNKYSGDITAEVVCRLNTKPYDERVRKRREAEKTKKEMDKLIKEMDEVNKYEMYAKQNPELQELLQKFKELTA